MKRLLNCLNVSILLCPEKGAKGYFVKVVTSLITLLIANSFKEINQILTWLIISET